VVLFQLVTGTLPFDAETMPQLIAQILHSPLPSLSRSEKRIPSAVASAIKRCLEKERDRRFGSVHELAKAIAPFAPEGDAAVERIAGVLGRAQVGRRSKSASRLGRSRARWALVGASLLVAATAAAVVLRAQHPAPMPAAPSPVATPIAAPQPQPVREPPAPARVTAPAAVVETAEPAQQPAPRRTRRRAAKPASPPAAERPAAPEPGLPVSPATENDILEPQL
jgi:serine/threonine-protein kinase